VPFQEVSQMTIYNGHEVSGYFMLPGSDFRG
jgi:hypothetical protein